MLLEKIDHIFACLDPVDNGTVSSRSEGYRNLMYLQLQCKKKCLANGGTDSARPIKTRLIEWNKYLRLLIHRVLYFSLYSLPLFEIVMREFSPQDNPYFRRCSQKAAKVPSRQTSLEPCVLKLHSHVSPTHDINDFNKQKALKSGTRLGNFVHRGTWDHLAYW